MANAPVVLTNKQASTLKKIERQESNLIRIKDANTLMYEEMCTDVDLTPTPPERKMAIHFGDSLRPFLTIGEFVKVEEKTSSGHNRPTGYGYITETFGVGAAAFYSVKFTPAYDSARTYKNIRLCDLTPCKPFGDCISDDVKRIRLQTTAPCIDSDLSKKRQLILVYRSKICVMY